MDFLTKEAFTNGYTRPYYRGPLGPILHNNGSATLFLWSPSADKVQVVLYDRENPAKVVKDDLSMEKSEKGSWYILLNENNTGLSDLEGFYYHYKITRKGKAVLALDPYAPSMATWNQENPDTRVGKGAIVNPSAIGPNLAFPDIEGYEKREDGIIYEVHVRDFTSDPNIESELKHPFGTFTAFIDRLDYIKDLGVTHVQLLPVMSYYFANETKRSERNLEYSSKGNIYNWGYDPHSYFSITGMYSEDPADPTKRIEEFKTLVQAIHKRGMGVILDVVYNHTASVHILEDLEPQYYHFMNADGTPRESFGGGRLGTTHRMARRLLLDSILYWVREYKVDGFRFDMMGDHDAETIQMAYDESVKINPNILMIGEGWRTYAGDEGGRSVLAADQDWMQYTQSVGSFSDEFRNELKSGFGSEGQPRFLTGGPRSIHLIYDNLRAMPQNFKASHPGDVVPYIEAHDNLTLHDVIAQSIKKDPKYHEEEIQRRIRLGNLMVLTAQGTAFVHAGQEYGRTKQFLHPDYREPVKNPPYKSTFMTDQNGKPFEYPYFIHDSYDSSDAINLFHWARVEDAEKYPHQVQTKDYTKGLIHLRRSSDAFRHKTMDAVFRKITKIHGEEIGSWDLVIAYRLENSEGTEAYYIFINADLISRKVTFHHDLRNGEVLVDRERAGTRKISDPTGFFLDNQSITMDPLTAVVIRTKEVYLGY